MKTKLEVTLKRQLWLIRFMAMLCGIRKLLALQNARYLKSLHWQAASHPVLRKVNSEVTHHLEVNNEGSEVR